MKDTYKIGNDTKLQHPLRTLKLTAEQDTVSLDIAFPTFENLFQ